MRHKREQFLAGLVVFLGIAFITVIGLETVRVAGFPKSNFDFLPLDNTVYAIEWADAEGGEQSKYMLEHLGVINYQLVAQAEVLLLPKPYADAVRISGAGEKTLAGISYNGVVHPTFILEVGTDSQEVFTAAVNKGFDELVDNDDGDWIYRFKSDRVIISQNRDVNNIVANTAKAVTSYERYADAIHNIPKLSFGNFYINHKLMNNHLIGSVLNDQFIYSKELLDIFGVTLGAISADENGVFISSYTNPLREGKVKFPGIRDEYQASFTQYIPEGPQLFIGGQDLKTRFYQMIENLGNPDHIERNLEGFLIGHNLGDDALKLLNDLFEKEYAIALYEEGALFVVESSEDIAEQLNLLAAYYNPQTVSYLLPDGQRARQLVPGEEDQYFEVVDGTFVFQLDEPLYLRQNDHVSYISRSLDLINKSIDLEDHYQAKGFEQIIMTADEIVQIQPQKLHEYVKDYLELSDLPTITSGFSYYDDGIQTIHFLAW